MKTNGKTFTTAEINARVATLEALSDANTAAISAGLAKPDSGALWNESGALWYERDRLGLAELAERLKAIEAFCYWADGMGDPEWRMAFKVAQSACHALLHGHGSEADDSFQQVAREAGDLFETSDQEGDIDFSDVPDGSSDTGPRPTLH